MRDLSTATTPEAAAAIAREGEAAGDSLGATRAWQVVLKLRPDDEEALGALAVLYEERGDLGRSEACRGRARAVRASDGKDPRSVAGNVGPRERSAGAEPSAGDPLPGNPLPGDPFPGDPGHRGEPAEGPSDGDLVRFLDRFGGREDVHARMWRNGEEVGWSPVPTPLGVDALQRHVRGSETLGVYCVTLSGGARFLCLDLDVTRDALQRVRGDRPGTTAVQEKVAVAGLSMADRLREAGVEVLLEDSGYKGRHLWIFLQGESPAARVHALCRSLARALQPADPDLRVEPFPRQAAVKDQGVGSLIKLPLGVHLRTGRRTVLLGEEGRAEADPWARLRRLRRYSLEELERRLGSLVALAAALPAREETGPPLTASEGRPWCEGDFDGSPSVGPVLRGCAVLREVVREALSQRKMGREEALVLGHSLGHLPDGPRAVNYLQEQVPGFTRELRMGAPHRGSPVSCASIRRKLAGVADRVGCECSFQLPPGGYPHPLRHLGELPPVAPAGPGPEEALDAYARALDRQRRVGGEVAELRRQVVALLERSPDRRWRHGAGEWVLAGEEGLPTLEWVPEGREG